MSYHKFPSIGQVFLGDLRTKLTNNVISEDFADLPCNCDIPPKVNSECMVSGDYRISIAV